MRGRLAWLGALLLVIPSALQARTPPETIEYYALDVVGSVRVVFDATGAIIGRMDYGPFGEELSAGTNLPDRRFAGLFRDGEAGLDSAGARSYQVRTGRFSTVDPVYAGLFEPQRWNRYAYALNTPLRMTDSNGLSAVKIGVTSQPGCSKFPNDDYCYSSDVSAQLATWWNSETWGGVGFWGSANTGDAGESGGWGGRPGLAPAEIVTEIPAPGDAGGAGPNDTAAPPNMRPPANIPVDPKWGDPSKWKRVDQPGKWTKWVPTQRGPGSKPQILWDPADQYFSLDDGKGSPRLHFDPYGRSVPDAYRLPWWVPILDRAMPPLPIIVNPCLITPSAGFCGAWSPKSGPG